jgi:two-component system NtrC family sensor kinase
MAVFSVMADETVVTSKRIIIGGDYDYPPYEFIDKDGRSSGYNVELSQEIAAVMGMDIEFRLGTWGEIRELFDRGEIDIVQGMAALKQRMHLYEFSPHTFVNQSVFARNDSPILESLDGLKNHQVIVQRNGSMYDLLVNVDKPIELIPVDTHADALRLLASGKHDYAVVSNLPGLYLSQELGLSNIKPVYSIEGTNKYGYAVKKGNEELLSKFSQGLAILKNTGRQQAIYEKWFGALQRSPWTRFGLIAAAIAVMLIFVSTGIVIWNRALRKKVESRTQELKTQQLQLLHADKMASLGVLVSGVAHEINNPCGILTLNFPLVRDVFEQIEEILDEYQEEQGGLMIAGVDYARLKTMFPETLEDMHIASRKIRAIVEDLKHFASKDSSDLELNELLDLNKLVEVSMRLVANQIKQSTNYFEVHYGDNLPLFKGSGQRIEQVVINLILNACQALNDKEQKISIRTLYDDAQQHVVFTITDHGIGIKEDDLSKLTDPFFTSKREQGGMGLGLSVSAGIVRDHQGVLDFRSMEGKGTSVKLSLPLEHKEDGL